MMPEEFDVERDLRRALHPVDPTKEFSAQFVARRPVAFWKRPVGRLAIAASLIVFLLVPAGVMEERARERRRGEKARDELITALHITGKTLQKTRQRVVRQLNRRGSI